MLPGAWRFPLERGARSVKWSGMPCLLSLFQAMGLRSTGLGPTPATPVYCVRIQARGRIDSIRLAATSGDPLADRAIPGTLRGLSFVPAERDGVPVTAWHRLLVNQPD